MGRIERFEDLEVWRNSRRLAFFVYELTRQTRLSGHFDLKDQMNRAAGSAMDNIAEGFNGGSYRVFIRYLRIAKASTSEIQSQLYRALDRKCIESEEFDEAYSLCDLVARQVQSLINYLLRYHASK